MFRYIIQLTSTIKFSPLLGLSLPVLRKIGEWLDTDPATIYFQQLRSIGEFYFITHNISLFPFFVSFIRVSRTGRKERSKSGGGGRKSNRCTRDRARKTSFRPNFRDYYFYTWCTRSLQSSWFDDLGDASRGKRGRNIFEGKCTVDLRRHTNHRSRRNPSTREPLGIISKKSPPSPVVPEIVPNSTKHDFVYFFLKKIPSRRPKMASRKEKNWRNNWRWSASASISNNRGTGHPPR